MELKIDEPSAMFYWNELLNTDSSSSDTDDDLEFEVRGPMILRPRIRNYIEEVVDSFTEEEFRQNFRMNRTTFDHVLSIISKFIQSDITDRGRHTISGRSQLLIALWYFGTPDSFRSICSRFNVGKATALRTVRRVANALLSISQSIIMWPTGEYFNEVINGFNEMGFPNTIGCIDGMYVKIPKPKDYSISYICRKNFPSIILQAVCDNKLKFTHCYAGEVGSTHDAMVLKRSEIWLYINNQFQERFTNDSHLIGDKAYPCLPQLITPYKDNGHLTDPQKNFNYLLSSTRSTIERAFNLLQKRFRCLKDLLDVQSLEWIPIYIIACCVLHNICIMQNDVLDVQFVPTEEDNNGPLVFREINRERLHLGRQKRDRLCQLLNN